MATSFRHAEAPLACSAALVSLALLGCREPTQVTVAISTDAACESLVETGITVGAVHAVEPLPPATTTSSCEADGNIGSIVVVPSGDDGDEWALRVVSSLSTPLDQCVPPGYGDGCIVARRALHFLPHTSLEMPVVMRASCAGVICPEDQTCVGDACRSATVDPGDCLSSEGCGEGAIGVPDLGPWALGLGAAGADLVRDLAVGPNGRVYVTGAIGEGVNLGGADLTPSEPGAAPDAGDIFLASFSPRGAHRWSRSFGGASLDEGASVAVDRAGNVLLLGSFSGEVDFGTGPLDTHGATEVVLASFASWGKSLWSIAISGSSGITPGEVAAGRDGNLFVTGAFSGTLKIGSTSVESAGDTDVFLASFTRAGELLWAHALGGPEEDSGSALAVGPDDDVYVTGYFNGVAGFGGSVPLAGKGRGDVFVASFTGGGELRWAKGFGESAPDRSMDIAVSAEGRVAVTGQIGKATTIDGTPLPATETDGFVAVFDGDGSLAWARAFGAASLDWGKKVAFGEDGALYLSGTLFDEAVLGSVKLEAGPEGASTPFVAVFDPAGEALWGRTFATTLYADVGGVAPAGKGDVYVAGYFNPDLDMGDGVPATDRKLEGHGDADLFLARVTPP